MDVQTRSWFGCGPTTLRFWDRRSIIGSLRTSAPLPSRNTGRDMGFGDDALNERCSLCFPSAAADARSTSARRSPGARRARAIMQRARESTGNDGMRCYAGNYGANTKYTTAAWDPLSRVAEDPLYDVHSESGIRMVVSHLHGLTRPTQPTAQQPPCQESSKSKHEFIGIYRETRTTKN